MRLSGKLVVLRDDRRDADDEDLFRWLNLEEWQYYDEPDQPFRLVTREEFESKLKQRRRRPAARPPGSHRWQIDCQGGRHIGWVNYYHLDEQAQRAYVGICLPEEEAWGHGYGTEAISLVVDYLFRQMNLHEVRTATWTGNKRMMRCAQKSGFRIAARMPHSAQCSVRGEPLERIEFSISREEWLAQEEVGTEPAPGCGGLGLCDNARDGGVR